MRLAPVLLLIAAYPSTVSVGCTPSPERPAAEADYTTIELHSWAKSRRHGDQHWVTKIEPDTGCVSTETLDDGILHLVRDCSFAALIQPRLAELIAVFEESDPQAVGERVGDGNEGHGAVFELGDGTRWTADSKLLREGAELLDGDTSEWLLIAPTSESPPPTPDGWTQMTLRNQKGVLERQLASDGRWSCESWVVSNESLEHFILIRRGRIEPARAAELLDGFADGLAPVLAGAAEAEWSASLAPEDQTAAVRLQGEELVRRWDGFSAELDPDCVLDPPPSM